MLQHFTHINFIVELDQIQDEFVQYCGTPSGLMNFSDFKKLIRKLGLADLQARNCFRYNLHIHVYTCITSLQCTLHVYSSACTCIFVLLVSIYKNDKLIHYFQFSYQ